VNLQLPTGRDWAAECGEKNDRVVAFQFGREARASGAEEN